MVKDNTPSLIAEADGDALVARARTGDQSAWAELVREIGPAVRGLARAKGVRDPDDVTQDVFLAVASRLDRFEGGWAAFRSWLFTIAYRKIIDRWRAAGRQRPHGQLPAQFPDRRVPGPEEEAVTLAVAGDALAALGVLSDVERDVVLLRVLADLDTREVAAALGKRPGNVRVIQSRALKKLRFRLEEQGYGGSRQRRRAGRGAL